MKSYKAINILIEPILQITLGTPHPSPNNTINISIRQNIVMAVRLGEETSQDGNFAPFGVSQYHLVHIQSPLLKRNKYNEHQKTSVKLGPLLV